MLLLANGCRCSELKVHPFNWKSPSADLSITWFIHYRFYDPGQPKPKQVIIKGMNATSDRSQRKAITQTLLETELDMLTSKGYNPFAREFMAPDLVHYEIEPGTPLASALTLALEKVVCVRHTRDDIRSVIKSVKKSSYMIGLGSLKIGEVKKRHVRMILDNLSKTNKRWSPNLFNHYRKYLSILFTELMELDAIELNPITGIAKQKTVRKIRLQLKPKQRKEVDEFLRANHYTFWRFMQIFFHSGARTTELMALRTGDIDLEEQEFKVTVLKGSSQIEAIKPIKNIILPLWQEIMNESTRGQFLFSKFLKPGDTQINPRQVTRRWKEHVKKELGIRADFYSLKHTNLDQTAEILDIHAAAKMAGHSTPVITMDYASGENKRQRDRLKEVRNSFT